MKECREQFFPTGICFPVLQLKLYRKNFDLTNNIRQP